MLLVGIQASAADSLDDSVGYQIRAAAEQGSINDEYHLGLMYQSGNGAQRDDVEAFKWFHKAAIQQHIDAEAKVCAMYISGVGVVKDERDSFGQLMVGMAYSHSLYGIKQNLAEAVKWYRRAAANGVAAAQANLGYAYALGMGGLEKDYVQADMWATLAEEQNDPKTPKARAFLDSLEKRMSSEQIDTAKRLAKQWKERATILPRHAQ
jgi:TPR repeat protein